MKTIQILMILLTFGRSQGKPLELWDEIDHKIWETLQRPAPKDIDRSWLTDDIRPEVTARLLENLNDFTSPNSVGIRRKAEESLVAIDHIETIERLVAKTQVDRNDRTLNDHATEVAIPYMVPVVYNGSKDLRKPEGDVGYSSVRDAFARGVLLIIGRSKNFPPETRDWAEKMQNFYFHTDADNEERIDLIKYWWENNRKAIEEKRYADATWLPHYKGKIMHMTRWEFEDRAALEAPKAVVRKSMPSAPAQNVSRKEKSAPWLWISIGALIMLLAGFFLRRRLAAKAV